MNKITVILIIVIISIIYLAYGRYILDNAPIYTNLNSSTEFVVIKPLSINNKNNELFDPKVNTTDDNSKTKNNQLIQRDKKNLRKELLELNQNRNKLRYVKLAQLMDKIGNNKEFQPGSPVDIKRLKHNLKVTQEITKLSQELFNTEAQDYEQSAINIAKLMELQMKLIVPTYSAEN